MDELQNNDAIQLFEDKKNPYRMERGKGRIVFFHCGCDSGFNG